jgi:hypothetical protein
VTAAEIRAQVEKLAALEAKLDGQLQQLDTRPESAGRDLVSQALDGKPANAISRHADAVSKSAVLIEAITDARRRRLQALKDLQAAEGAVLREQAALRRQDAEKRQGRIRELLAEVEAYDGCEYGVLMQAGPYGSVVPVTRSKTQALLDEATELESQARSAEGKDISLAGMIRADDLEDLLDDEVFSDAYRVAPPLHEVRAWGSTIVQRSRTSGRFQTIGTQQWFFQLVWHDGQIDGERSWYMPRDMGVRAQRPTRMQIA